jgi:hypothetical protein
MARCSVRQCTVCQNSLSQLHSYGPTKFQRHDVSSHNTLLLRISKWRQEGSVKDSKPRGRPLSARTPDNVESVRVAMLRIQRGSVRR